MGPRPAALREDPGHSPQVWFWGMSGPWEPGQAGGDLEMTPALQLSPGAEGSQRAQLGFPGQSRAAGDGGRAGAQLSRQLAFRPAPPSRKSLLRARQLAGAAGPPGRSDRGPGLPVEGLCGAENDVRSEASAAERRSGVAAVWERLGPLMGAVRIRGAGRGPGRSQLQCAGLEAAAHRHLSCSAFMASALCSALLAVCRHGSDSPRKEWLARGPCHEGKGLPPAWGR
uniref:Uncharacterized protein n=1 Tax=Rangifer tarandus platyrhynchus TaxID=3082113 RepID=A0ACB0DQ79_RANTA|nr:unnamed protein product [Rangifer tarandus platyrhynchus]